MRSREIPSFSYAAFGLGNGGVLVKGEACVDFGGNPAGDDFENLETEEDEDPVHHSLNQSGPGESGILVFGHGFFDDGFVFGLAGSLKDQRRIGSRVLRLVFLHRGKVSCVGNDGREFFQAIKLR